MRFLIYNYSTPWSTEPHYLNASLNVLNAYSATFDNTKSLYDNFDLHRPDVFITHISALPRDFIEYQKNNPDKNIQLALNINGVQSENLKIVIDTLNNNNVKFILFGNYDPNIQNAKFVKILPAADLFMNNAKKFYDIDKAIFVSEESQIKEYDNTYHIFTTNQDISDKVDFLLSIFDLNSILVNYKEIVFKDVSFLNSQVLFDAIKYNTKVTFDFKNSNDTDKINDIFKGEKLFPCMKYKHTCFNRLKTLVSQISGSDKIVEQINNRIEKL
jgi:hypothetical protein